MRSFKIICFLVLNALIVVCINTFLNYGNPMYLQQLELKKCNQSRDTKAYNTVILGTSDSQVGIDPLLLDELTGWRTFNLSQANVTLSDILYMVKDLHENYGIERVVYELDYAYWRASENLGAGQGYNMFFMGSNFKIKSGYLFNVLPKQNFVKTFTTNLLSPKRLKNSLFSIKYLYHNEANQNAYEYLLKHIYNQYLTENSINAYEHNGWWKGLNYDYAKRNAYIPNWFDAKELNCVYLLRFHQLAEYCKEEGIELYILQTPVSPKQLYSENREDAHEYLNAVCLSENLTFYDSNYLKAGCFPRNNDDYYDFGGHMMWKKAQEYTKLLSEIFTSADYSRYFYTDYDDVKSILSVNGDSIK